MGFRYYKRKKVGNNGGGFNFSKSGVSYSVRRKWGSVGTKGYSIRTGIPGLSFRGGNGKNDALTGIITLLIFGAFILAWNILKVIIQVIIQLITQIFNSIFKQEGINYTNLSLFLGCILTILVTVYFNMPSKSLPQYIVTTIDTAKVEVTAKNLIKKQKHYSKLLKSDSVTTSISDTNKNLSLVSTNSDSTKKDSTSIVNKNMHVNSIDSNQHLNSVSEKSIAVITKETPDYIREALAVAMLKRGKNIDEVIDSTFLKKHRVKVLKRDLNL